MGHEIHEYREHAQEAAHFSTHDPTTVRVTVTMAILAVFVAAVGLLGHRAHTEEVVFQNKASDQWQYYQAKNTRRHTYELFLDLLPALDTKEVGQADKLKEKYTGELRRYEEDQKEIEARAREFEKEVALERSRANRFDLGEVGLEAALVIASMTLLTGRRIFWILGIATGFSGLLAALTGFGVG